MGRKSKLTRCFEASKESWRNKENIVERKRMEKEGKVLLIGKRRKRFVERKRMENWIER